MAFPSQSQAAPEFTGGGTWAPTLARSSSTQRHRGAGEGKVEVRPLSSFPEGQSSLPLAFMRYRARPDLAEFVIVSFSNGDTNRGSERQSHWSRVTQ